MAIESGKGEGQDLAHRLLEALAVGRDPDWEAFHATYHRWLIYVASGCFTRHDGLASVFETPAELVNAFLAEKILPPRQAWLMFGAPACGACPLRPRLAVSLRNFYVDALRSSSPAEKRIVQREMARIEATQELSLPEYEDVAAAIAQQLAGIRSCFTLKPGAPYRVALLLRHRLDWAGAFDGVQVQRSEGVASVDLTLDVLEKLSGWEVAELDAHLGESRHSLGKAWDLLKPRLVATADRRLSADEVAGVLHVPRDLWDQWISRARRRLRQHLGEGYNKVFLLWP